MSSSANRFSRTLPAVVLACLCTLVDGAERHSSARPAWTTSRLVGSPTPPEPYRLELAFPDLRFERPTCIEELPGTGRILVTEIGGRIFTFVAATRTSQADLLVDLRERLSNEEAQRGVSLFDAEPHPKFQDNHLLFVCYVHPGHGGHTRVSRFELSDEPSPRIIEDSEQVVITWPSGGHNGGCLEFGTDDYLYISTGDGSGPNPPDALTTGQDVSDLLGAILRIDVDHRTADQAYSIPTDNPFVQMQNARPEIWSYGLRNPWKFGVDPQDGAMFVADNGWETWEMVHRVVRGGNGGWPTMEGRAMLRSEVPPGPTPIIPPVKDHPHTEANSVIGGPVYRGSKLPDLDGWFVYGDYITGTLWAVHAKQGSHSHQTLVDTDQRVIAFTQTSDDKLLVLDFDVSGQIYELLPSAALDHSASFPRRLSETGLFASTENLQPAPGVVPYEVCVSRWMDGAIAQRWVAIPGQERVELPSALNQGPRFPEGTVFVKHLSWPVDNGQPPLRLETQILHFEQGTWRPYSYMWDESGQDATLVDSIGSSRALAVTAANSKTGAHDRTWRVNATNECKLCHNAGPGFVLGFTPEQLNVPGSGHSGAMAQLQQLVAQGVLKDAPSAHLLHFALVDPRDSSQDLDARARSYLHANCSMCHHPGGNAIVSFYLRRDLPFEQLNTNKGTGIGTFGIREARVIAPGDPYRSLLLYRMAKLGYARMPYIGSHVVDGDAVSLVAEWIRSLPNSDLAHLSAPLQENAAAQQALLALDYRDGHHDEAIRELLSSTEGSLALVERMHRGAISEEDSATLLQQSGSLPSDRRGLFETFVPESQRRPTLGASVDSQLVLSREGDPDRGKLIYFSDTARCRACHDVEDRAKSLGPTLHEISKKYLQNADLLQHIVQPQLKIEEAFASYSVVTDDGLVITGLIVGQDDKQVVIKTAEQQQFAVARERIEELRKGDKSLMPDQVLADLTAQEAADLLAFIRTLSE